MNPHLIDSIKKHEELRLKAYQDTVGVWSIGYGTNLQVLEITEHLAEEFLAAAVFKTEAQLSKLPTFAALDGVRQGVLIEMSYQLGVMGCLKFRQMWDALARGDYWAAASEMVASKWSKQTPNRVEVLASRMRHGTWTGLPAV